MLPTRIEIVHKEMIRNMVGMIPYTPRDNELYTYIGIPIDLIWISIEKDIYHSPDGEKISFIVWLLGEFAPGGKLTDHVLHLVTSYDHEPKVAEILETASIKLTNVERANSRSSDESNAVASVNNTRNNSVSDNWLARFGRWLWSFFFG